MERRILKIKVYAKINLSLNITGVSGDMHLLDSVCASVDIADIVTFRARADGQINVTYSVPDIIVGDDSVTRAAKILQETAGSFGADIFVEKNIPLCAGLGGSSADAAAVFAACRQWYGFSGADENALALRVGSDVPYGLRGGYCRVTGTGGRTDCFDAPAVLYAVVAKGKRGVLSRDSYRAFDEMYPQQKFCPADNGALVAALKANDTAAVYRQTVNALYEPSRSLNPAIADTLAALNAAGAAQTVMTGSGAACVGLFKNGQEAAAAAEKLRQGGLYAVYAPSKAAGIAFI